MRTLCEQYRPTSFDEFLGQDKAVAKIAALRRRGLAGRVYWISGPSGTGKTTLAMLIGRELADPFYIQELDAGALCGSVLREWESQSHYGAPGPGGRVFIVNESHGLSKAAVRQLLVSLERVPNHVAWIFTTTTDGMTLFEDCHEDASPLLSRCTEIKLTSQGLKQVFAERAMAIAQAEGLDGQPIEKYLRLVQDNKNNMRAVLQKIEEGGMLA